MTACLVLAYNEENHIEETLTSVSLLFDLIIVVNDGSTDKTIQKINDLSFKNINLINNEKNLGAGKSLLIGIKEFLNSDESHLIKIDGDNQFKKHDIERLIDLSHEGYDFIKCDRFWEKGIEGKIPTIRYVGNALATLMIKIATGNWKLNDPLNGLFMFSRNSIKSFSLPKIFNKYGYPFFINTYMSRQIVLNNLKVGQINNTVKYSDEKSALRPTIMFVKLLYFSIYSFCKKIKVKFQYSNLQISALFDLLFLLFTSFTLYSGVKLLLINLEYSKGSKASWLFLTILLFLISSFCFSYSQRNEIKIFKDKFFIL